MRALALSAVSSYDHGFVVVGFMIFIVVALFLAIMGGPDGDSPEEFAVGSRTLTPFKNGAALSGTYLATTVLLNVTATVALVGFDGITVAVDLLLSLGLLAVLARPLRQSGGRTLGDLFALRFSGAAPRIAAAVATLAVSVPFLVIQLSSAGDVTAQLLGMSSIGAKQTCTVVLGVLVVLCPMLGGMKGHTLVQILSCAVTVVALGVATLALLAHFHGDFGALVSQAAQNSGQHDQYLQPGHAMGTTSLGRLDHLGLQLALVLGTPCMPHILVRIQASGDGAAARRSVRNACFIVAAVCLTLVLLGFGAAAVVGGGAIIDAGTDGNSSLLLIAHSLLGGSTSALGNLLFTAVACAAFLSVLSVVGGATLTAASSIARDVYLHAPRRRQSVPRGEVPVARAAAAVLGCVGIFIAVVLQGASTAFGSQLTMGIAASSILPALIYSLYWRGYNRTGLVWTIYGGTILALVLPVFSPRSDTSSTFVPHVDFAWFRFQSPALVSVPLAFLLGWMGSRMGRSRTTATDERRRLEADTLQLIGAGAERTG
ncbi:hypothetical protein ACIQPR_47045 [Streptomyces sp. NPDC091280]|uniref:sodium:solute symporter family transporter n=1 Tax=Streptomyces sp. NPDC091280 TaxID=3365984 RepID=UPI0038016BC3